MTATRIPAAKLPRLTTTELIEQYDLVTYGSSRGGMPNWSMRRARVSRIVDLLLDRAESGDEAAASWLGDAR